MSNSAHFLHFLFRSNSSHFLHFFPLKFRSFLAFFIPLKFRLFLALFFIDSAHSGQIPLIPVISCIFLSGIWADSSTWDVLFTIPIINCALDRGKSLALQIFLTPSNSKRKKIAIVATFHLRENNRLHKLPKIWTQNTTWKLNMFTQKKWTYLSAPKNQHLISATFVSLPSVTTDAKSEKNFTRFAITNF